MIPTPALPAKHQQVYDSLRDRIDTGHYQAGDRIPSEISLVREFGVSRPTVAKALQALERQGLVTRRQGSGTYVSGVTNGTRVFGLLIPGLGDTEIFEPICGEIARVAHRDGHALHWGAAEAAWNGDSSNNGTSNRGAIAWDLCQRFIREQVGGVFFAPLELIHGKDEVNRRVIAALEAAKIPVVLVDRDFVRYPGRSKFDLVGINNRRVGHTITDHLFEAGCESPLFLMRPRSASTIHARAAGFSEAFLTRRVPFDWRRVHECDPSDNQYVAQMLRDHAPDGIVCGDDVTAGYLLHTLDELGVRVPADILIAGINDVRYAELLRVPLTTVRQPFAEIGDAAYHAMLDRIARPHAAPRHITLGCELIVRESTRRK